MERVYRGRTDIGGSENSRAAMSGITEVRRERAGSDEEKVFTAAEMK